MWLTYIFGRYTEDWRAILEAMTAAKKPLDTTNSPIDMVRMVNYRELLRIIALCYAVAFQNHQHPKPKTYGSDYVVSPTTD